MPDLSDVLDPRFQPSGPDDRDALILALLRQARDLLAIELSEPHCPADDALVRHADLLIHGAMKHVREPLL